ncbi:MAG: hypothetical protein QGI83_21120, partial [Candidatus Latescibacteria bacterium]|nr:hypothetical protein [Candidatus Latescibacterota bacterium]
MNLRFHSLIALLSILTALPGAAWSQTIALVPDQIPNGIEKESSQQYHQRFNITLTGSPTAQTRAFTITLPPELEYVSSSVTATSNTANISAFHVGQGASSSELVFGLTLTAGSLSGETVAVEFDVTTPTDFTGIGDGLKQDTVYAVRFAPGTNLTNTNVPVAKHQNRRIQVISFSAPDSSVGDTTSAGGRFYKLRFPSALPDLSHTDLSGLSASSGYSDGATDVVYSFYWAADSTLINQGQGGTLAGIATLRADGSGPLLGSRQAPRTIPATFIREDYASTFFTDSADSSNGVISLAGTQDDTYHYIYILADPAPDRLPSARPNFGAPARKGYDPTQVGTFSGGAYLGRSGPLLVTHAPEFVVVGWDYDTDNGDDFDNTGVVQVPSDIVGMAAVDVNRKDNRNLTLDTGSWVEKGDAFSGVNSGLTPGATDRVDLLFQAQDDDNAFDFEMAIFLAMQDGLTVDDLVGGGIDSLRGAIKVTGTDTLTINHRTFSFSPIVTDTTTGLAVSFIPAGSYRVYFAATDGTYRTLTQVLNDPFIASPSGSQLAVAHSPMITPDVFSLNDFDGSGDGDLDVVTGIDVSQMMVDGDGKDLKIGPSQRYVTLSWASQGRDGDVDVDDSATIELYYSTRSDFKDSRGSVSYTSGNSQGDDLLADIGKSDTHLIGSVAEDPDGRFDNQLVWDLWTYVSAESTIPKTGVRYYLYALLKQSG